MEFNVLLAVLTAFTCLPSLFSGSSSVIVSLAQAATVNTLAADTTGTETITTPAATVTITELTDPAGTATSTQAATATITVATETSGTETTMPAATVTTTELTGPAGTATTTQAATVTITVATETSGTETTTPDASVTITEITDTAGTETITTQAASVTITEITGSAVTEITTQAATVNITEVSDKETSVHATLTSTSSFTQWCIDNCPTAEHKYCQLINSNPDNTGTWNVSSCSCQPGYLPVGSDCVADDLIIGVSVGVGAAIILGLTIAVICLAVRKPSHSSGKSDTNSSDGKEFVQMEEAPVNKSTTTEAEHAPAAAAAAVISGDVAHVVKVDDSHVTTAAAAAVVVTAAAGSNVKAATGAAVVTAAVVEPHTKLEPQTSPVTAFPVSYAPQPQIMTPDYDLSEPMPLNTHYNSNAIAASIVTFAPQLQNVDTFSNFAIKRPTAVTSGSQPGLSFQNPSYKDFF